jgi:hypothetical protein
VDCLITLQQMTLLAAVHSLGMIELAAVSWINVRPVHTCHVAVFTVALLLPLGDPVLSRELCTGAPRFWPDQTRLLHSEVPMQDQISELEQSQLLGNLKFSYLTASENEEQALWMIETHAGSEEERMDWLGSVIAMEGRRAVLS